MGTNWCSCGGRATGRCMGCGSPLCNQHVATRRSWNPQWPLNHAQSAMPDYADQPARVRLTVHAVREDLNDKWLCGECLSNAERAATQSLIDCPAPLLRAGGLSPLKELERLRQTRQFAPFYSTDEWRSAVLDVIAEMGGFAGVCQRAANHAWQVRPHSVIRGYKPLFGAAPTLEVVRVGRTPAYHSTGGADPLESGGSDGVDIVVDETCWYQVSSSAWKDRPIPWDKLTPDETLAWASAIPILLGADHVASTGGKPNSSYSVIDASYRPERSEGPPVHRGPKERGVTIPDSAISVARTLVDGTRESP